MEKTFSNLEKFYPHFYGKYDFPMIEKYRQSGFMYKSPYNFEEVK